MRHRHHEVHRAHRTGWLRAAVLGANDGIVSTASLLLGVASASASHGAILLAGLAGLVAGAMSMAAGEYVSVYSQADTEMADLKREHAEILADAEAEQRELTAIYVARGLDGKLASQVAQQLMAHDALGAHARDELGITDSGAARPLQAAFASASSFAMGAILPLAVAAISPARHVVPAVTLSALLFLAVLGIMAARAGGADMMRSIFRVMLWGSLAMAATWATGLLFGTAV
jgi:VIT1/CCC1 family predicted Fe2+/Mn2+ transporter